MSNMYINMINKSMETGELPKTTNHSIIALIFLKGDREKKKIIDQLV